MVRQPSNTYSNFGFYVVAAVLWWRSRHSKGGSHDVPFAWLSLLIGVASTVAHASLAQVFAIVDFTAIFVLFSYIITGNLAEIGRWSVRRRHTSAVGLSLLSILPQVFSGPRVGLPVFTAYLFGALATEVLALRRLSLKPTRRSYLIASLASLVGGLTCFFLDEKRIVCTPSDHVIQLHSAWHLLAALSLYFIALYFESKRVVTSRSATS